MRRVGERLGWIGRVALALLALPFYFFYGLVVLCRLLHPIGWALRRNVRCSRRHENPLSDRFLCARCRGTYHGWVGRCPLCGAGADLMTCSRCGLSIRLPWGR